MSMRGYRHDKFEQMREDAVTRILDAAYELFASNGYAGTTIQMIAKKAGLVPSGIYHYYTGKEDLLEAVLNREISAMDRTITVGLQRYFMGKGVGEFLDYMMESVCTNADRVTLICYLVRYRECIPEHCNSKLKLLRHFSEVLHDYIQSDKEMEQAWEILTEFCACAVFYSVTRHRDIFERQVSKIKERYSAITFHSTRL